MKYPARPINTGNFGPLRAHLRSPNQGHTEFRARGGPVYAIPYARVLLRGILGDKRRLSARDHWAQSPCPSADMRG